LDQIDQAVKAVEAAEPAPIPAAQLTRPLKSGRAMTIIVPLDATHAEVMEFLSWACSVEPEGMAGTLDQVRGQASAKIMRVGALPTGTPPPPVGRA
jgi:hypothetical protein